MAKKVTQDAIRAAIKKRNTEKRISNYNNSTMCPHYKPYKDCRHCK